MIEPMSTTSLWWRSKVSPPCLSRSLANSPDSCSNSSAVRVFLAIGKKTWYSVKIWWGSREA